MNEFELISALSSKLTQNDNSVIRSIGDDSACVRTSGNQILISCDDQIEGVHFLSSFGGFGVGYKLVVSNASDILASGGVPKWLTISLTTTPKTDLAWLEELYRGINVACTKYGIAVVGGNTAMAKELKIGATIIGETERFVARDTAKVGDLLFLSKPVGGSKAGLEALLAKQSDLITKKHLEIELPISLQPLISQYATSAIDISDGLFVDLMHIVNQSGIGFNLYDEKLLFDDELVAHLGCEKKAFEHALTSGEEYQLLFTVPKEHRDRFSEAILIGEAVEKQGIFLDSRPLTASGFLHF